MRNTLSMTTAASVLALLLASLVLLRPGGAAASRPQEESAAGGAATSVPEGARVFEMRTYYTSKGKLEHLHRRFRDHTNYLFVKHGMTLVGYWVPDDAEDTLVYVLAYPSLEARKTSWDAFLADAEWKRVYAASHEAAGGKIVQKVESRFLRPTDYSPIR